MLLFYLVIFMFLVHLFLYILCDFWCICFYIFYVIFSAFVFIYFM
jgi:hypothetical protein